MRVIFLCNFVRPKIWDKLSVNIDHVYCTYFFEKEIYSYTIFTNFVISTHLLRTLRIKCYFTFIKKFRRQYVFVTHIWFGEYN